MHTYTCCVLYISPDFDQNHILYKHTSHLVDVFIAVLCILSLNVSHIAHITYVSSVLCVPLLFLCVCHHFIHFALKMLKLLWINDLNLWNHKLRDGDYLQMSAFSIFFLFFPSVVHQQRCDWSISITWHQNVKFPLILYKYGHIAVGSGNITLPLILTIIMYKLWVSVGFLHFWDCCPVLVTDLVGYGLYKKITFSISLSFDTCLGQSVRYNFKNPAWLRVCTSTVWSGARNLMTWLD